jgi:isopenicillin-N epimerase
MNRRGFLVRAGLAATAGVANACRSRRSTSAGSSDEWDIVREQFNLSRDQIDLSALFIASHPKPVREAIEKYRATLDENPTFHLIREIKLYQDAQTVTADEIVNNIASAVAPETRVLALTWVHSSTGLKLPLKRIAEVLNEFNAKRDESQIVLMCVDGVHGFGVEDVEMKDTGCDFFMAGCHKWLFGPGGTGIIWGSERAWNAVRPTIPSFMDDEVRNAWMRNDEPSDRTTGRRMTPGGFKAFEHQWAVAEAFKFHLDIGKAKIAARTHDLNRQFKEGLAGMSHVKLFTSRDENLSSGIVCFDVDGMSPREVVGRLRQRQIVATPTPYADSHARVSPSIRNSPQEIDTALREIRSLA